MRKNIIYLPVYFICLFLTVFSEVSAEDDFQYWSFFTLKSMDTKYVDLSNFFQMRFYPDASKTAFWFASQKLQADVFKNLSVGVNYTYLENRTTVNSSGRTEFKYQHRLELETNPHFQPHSQVKIHNRNRVEFRWIEDRGSDNARFRQRWQAEYLIPKGGILRSVYVNNEYFVDFPQRTINENRAVPAGLTFRIREDNSLSFFYMIQSQKGRDSWHSNQILGTHLSLSL